MGMMQTGADRETLWRKQKVLPGDDKPTGIARRDVSVTEDFLKLVDTTREVYARSQDDELSMEKTREIVDLLVAGPYQRGLPCAETQKKS